MARDIAGKADVKDINILLDGKVRHSTETLNPKADVKDINILLDGKVRHSTETLNPKPHTLNPKSYARDNKFDELSAENFRFRAP